MIWRRRLRRRTTVEPVRYSNNPWQRLRFCYILEGRRGAVQFVFWATGEPAQGIDPKRHIHEGTWRVTGVDVGYHSRKRRNHWDCKELKCDVLDGTCYYSGSGLAASDLLQAFWEEGDEAVWRELERWYERELSGRRKKGEDD